MTQRQRHASTPTAELDSSSMLCRVMLQFRYIRVLGHRGWWRSYPREEPLQL